ALCDDMLARDREWPEPLRAHHARSLRAAVELTRTPTDVDVVMHHASACFAIEAAWLHALVATVGAPLRAALVASYESGVDVAAACDVARAITGEPDPLRLPWLATLIESFDRPTLGAHLGEAGFELRSPYRTWRGIGGTDLRALTRTAEPRTARDRKSVV